MYDIYIVFFCELRIVARYIYIIVFANIFFARAFSFCEHLFCINSIEALVWLQSPVGFRQVPSGALEGRYLFRRGQNLPEPQCVGPQETSKSILMFFCKIFLRNREISTSCVDSAHFQGSRSFLRLIIEGWNFRLFFSQGNNCKKYYFGRKTIFPKKEASCVFRILNIGFGVCLNV